MSTAVTSPDQLALYLSIRNSIDVVRELATGIDEDIGRRQIYGETGSGASRARKDESAYNDNRAAKKSAVCMFKLGD